MTEAKKVSTTNLGQNVCVTSENMKKIMEPVWIIIIQMILYISKQINKKTVENQRRRTMKKTDFVVITGKKENLVVEKTENRDSNKRLQMYKEKLKK